MSLLSQQLPFLFFAFVASITPGPTNILILTNSQRYGTRATLPAVAGACFASCAIVLLCGVGPGEALRHAPWLSRLMALAGALWLSVLSWQLFWSPAVSLAGEATRPFGARAAATLQLINPKTWMMAMAVVTVFAPRQTNPIATLLFQAGGFLVISLLCLAAWAWLGSSVHRVFKSPTALVRFQRLMALWLLACAWMGFFN
ncbi:Transporter, LysE family [Cronobacter condimenti 1330]|uniref:Lysine transporter LysE n=1 Tax=Cronobacter condimenti 1330 TaxID=1073999 RepID=K8ADP0_9ENTR|nr:LysE family translocator [Cronobacter condimenti]ALB63157.1 lysine transporter LysE [Cronobacter condimenti 1330]CCJ73904.1 Transporter, LysE family [Cronobacter condimenti 1330]